MFYKTADTTFTCGTVVMSCHLTIPPKKYTPEKQRFHTTVCKSATQDEAAGKSIHTYIKPLSRALELPTHAFVAARKKAYCQNDVSRKRVLLLQEWEKTVVVKLNMQIESNT